MSAESDKQAAKVKEKLVEEIKGNEEEIFQLKQKVKGIEEEIAGIKLKEGISNKEKQQSQLKEKIKNLENVLRGKKTEKERIEQEEDEKYKQEQRRKQEEQKKRQEEEKRRQEQERKRQEEQARRKEQERKRKQKIDQFKAKIQKAQQQITSLKERINQQSKKHPPSNDFETLVDYLDKSKAELQNLESKRQQMVSSLQSLKTEGDELSEKLPFDPTLPDLAQSINSQIDAIYQQESEAFKNDRQANIKKIKQETPPPFLPVGYRPFHPLNFYQDQVAKVEKEELIRLRELPVEEQAQQRKKVEERLEQMRKKQKFINQMKIFIELYQLTQEQLDRNNFDLPKFKHLMGRKAELIKPGREKKEGEGDQLARLQKELDSMTSILNTEGILVPFRYPQDLLVKAKQHLVVQFYQKESKKLEEALKAQQETNRGINDKLSLLKQQIQAKEHELLKENQAYQKLIQKQQQQLIKSLGLREDDHKILPKDVEDEAESKPSVVLTNKNEITELYTQLQDHNKTAKATQKLEQARAKKSALAKEFQQLNEQFRKIPINVEQYLVPTVTIQRQQESTEEELELSILLKQAEEIERRRQEKDSHRSSINIGRFSSILL